MNGEMSMGRLVSRYLQFNKEKCSRGRLGLSWTSRYVLQMMERIAVGSRSRTQEADLTESTCIYLGTKHPDTLQQSVQTTPSPRDTNRPLEVIAPALAISRM